MLRAIGLAILALLLLFALSAHADAIIWDNGTPNMTGMWLSTGGYEETENGVVVFEALENFTLPPEALFGDPKDYSEHGSLTDIHWWGYQILPAGTTDPVSTSSFYMLLLTSDWSVEHSFIGQPQVTFTGQSIPLENGREAFLFEYDLPFSGSLNTLGSEYGRLWYLLIHSQDGSDWAWAESNVNGIHYTTNFGGYGEETPGELAFYIRGEVNRQVIPEPATLSLLGLGLLGLTLRRLRSK
jgi:hypothetical protein